MRGNRRRWTWLIATGSVVTAFAGLAAIASGALSQHQKSVNIDAAADGTATASCPSGTEAVSGGFSAPTFDPQFNEASNIPFGSRRAGNGGWKVDAKNFGQASGKLTSYVYCDEHKPGLVVASKQTTIDAETTGSATATCPSGSEAYSGGWRSEANVTGDDAFFAFTSMRASNRKWKVTAFNEDDDDARQLEAFAYCDKRQPGLVERSKDTKVLGGVKTTLTPECPNGRQAVSGGFESSELTPNQADAAFTVTSRRGSNSTWRTVAYGNGKPTDKSPIKAFAYCKS